MKALYSTLIVTLFISAGFAQALVNLPQVAVGGPISTYITVVESNNVSKEVQIDLFDDNGSPFLASFDGGAAVSNFTFNLGPFTERVFMLTSSGPARAGWARLTTSGPGQFNASERFVISGDSAGIVDAVGVLPTEENVFWSITFDRRNSSQNVGVAVVNPTDRILDVTFDLFVGPNRAPGTGTVRRSLAPRGHLASYITEIFSSNFIGTATLEVRTGTNRFGDEISVMVLRQDGSQLSSLPANKPQFIWDWVSPATGTPSAGGYWFWTHLEKDRFFGTEVNTVGTSNRVFLRGSWDGNRFAAERLFTNPDGSRGMQVYQGAASGELGRRVIQGTLTVLTEAGAVTLVQSFRATEGKQ
ncbi:MAG: hypothetical protein HYX74_01720 [Acidobacteria bacterium]|nr:hypothetical protein [Acidobacteriota bacterium]